VLLVLLLILHGTEQEQEDNATQTLLPHRRGTNGNLPLAFTNILPRETTLCNNKQDEWK